MCRHQCPLRAPWSLCLWQAQKVLPASLLLFWMGFINGDDWRCPDATCVGNEEDCPVDAVCPYPFGNCPDGSCASHCSPFNGCPVGSPIIVSFLGSLCFCFFVLCLMYNNSVLMESVHLITLSAHSGVQMILTCAMTINVVKHALGYIINYCFCVVFLYFYSASLVWSNHHHHLCCNQFLYCLVHYFKCHNEYLLSLSFHFIPCYPIVPWQNVAIKLTQKRKRDGEMKMMFEPVADSVLRGVGGPWTNEGGFERNLASMVVNITMVDQTCMFSFSFKISFFFSFFVLFLNAWNSGWRGGTVFW